MKMCVFCKTRYKRGSGVSFHKFPPYPLRRLWIQNMGLVNFVPKDHDYLCSRHFADDCLHKQFTRNSVNKDCVPTLFDIIIEQQANSGYKNGQEVKENRKKLQCTTDTDLQKSADTFNCPAHIFVKVPSVEIATKPKHSGNLIDSKTPKAPKTIFEKREDVQHDHSYRDLSATSTKLKRVQKALKHSRASVKILSQRVKRLKLSISRLKSDLKNKTKNDKEMFILQVK